MNGGAWAGSANATVPQDGGDALTETTRAIWGNVSLVSAALKTMAAAAAVAAIGAEWSILGTLPAGSWSLGMLDDPVPWLQELEQRGFTAAVYEGISTN